MNLKTKSILAVNTIVIIVCVLMGIIGYFRAGEVFAKALELKASADVRSVAEILNYRFEGDWHLEDGKLFKGEQQMDGADALVDSLSQVCGGKVTIFNGDTRVATTVKNAQGSRAVGTKASEAIISNVITQGNFFSGEAMVMGEQHYAAYQPIKDGNAFRWRRRQGNERYVNRLDFLFDRAGNRRYRYPLRYRVEFLYRKNRRATRFGSQCHEENSGRRLAD